MLIRLRAWLNAVPVRDPIERRQAPLIQIMLLGLLVMGLLALLFLIINGNGAGGQLLSLLSTVILILSSGAALVLLRHGQLGMAVTAAALGFLPGQMISLVSAGLQNGLLLLLVFMLPITLVGLLARRQTLIVTIGICVGIVAGVAFLEHWAPTLVGFAPPHMTDGAILFVFTSILAVLGLFLDRFSSSLRLALRAALAREQELERLRAAQDATIAERTAALQIALSEVEARAAEQARLLEENEQQRQTILELSVPVLPINATTLVMPLVGALDGTRLMQIQTQALQAIENTTARRLLLDITGVPVVDSQVAQGLLAVVRAAGLLGAEVVLVGIRPEVAQAIVGLGLDFQRMRASSDLQSALRLLNGSETSYPRHTDLRQPIAVVSSQYGTY